MTVGETRIRNIDAEERQIIYDALVYYMFNESEIGRSNHFAADIHAEIANKASKMAIQLREAWADLRY